jgi:hypothetical protein
MASRFVKPGFRNCSALERVGQLAQVAGPGVRAQAGEAGRGRRAGRCGRSAGPARRASRRTAGLEVFEALAQRREAQREHVEAVVEILAEAALGDRAGEVDVGGGEDADVDPDGAVAADGLEGALLQDAQQLGLGVDRELADLVEQEGAAVGHLEPAGAVLGGPGEGAADVAEQLALEQVRGDRGAVEGDERALGAGAPAVDRAGEALLAGAGLAEDQHRGVGRGDLAGLGREGPHDRAVRALEHAVGLGLLVEARVGVLALLGAQALEREPLLGVLEREAEDLPVGLDEVDDRLAGRPRSGRGRGS